ncbi:MAG: ModE family transcriptional regulator [Hyphomonas sp.]|jgi:molybdate transport system regulatory protein|uniref:winged helix-turn-helix domain-containing protein n=1 Tax=Hyphomonas sp. TaxID=87 RepID=UPI001D3AA754|nr:LysR family transcriptional regulator [Hyphomonas sp.]MBA4040742.1 ModE family transcriptional regulator [Sphingobium sp.]MBA4045100.1 ModE family transcriptional regulator [Erythrobacter sp.]MBA4164789.1 ModE family transcriptional regulator [Erythrobacter sp.]MBA4228637.1 ModE family transcriptional regulator [Hyphomonas sp.]
MTWPSPLKLKIQIMCSDEIAMGPGKADLLDAIAANRSISAAGRAMGMSYRRTWLLVDAMNRCWQGPLVATVPGNQKAGAHLTPLGEVVLAGYRQLQGDAEVAASAGFAAIAEALLPSPRPPKRNEGPA